MEIYKITNQVTGKVYVGLTRRTSEHRFKQHLYDAVNRKHKKRCRALHSAIQKYGADQFRIEVLEKCESAQDLATREAYWISHLDTLAPNGYNLRTGGDLGYTYSEESAERQRQAHLGRKHAPQAIEKLRVAFSGHRNPFYGKRHPQDTLDRIHAKARAFYKDPQNSEKIAQRNSKTAEALRQFAQTDDGLALAKRRTAASVAARSKPFSLVAPDGTRHDGVNLTQFAKDMGLSQASLHRVLRGRRRHYKGWTAASTSSALTPNTL